MKAAWHQSFVLQTQYAEECNKNITFRSIWGKINNFFGLETTGDKIWFFGFYTVALSILLLMIIISNAIDMI
jgi:hypothetical protein